jgi:hypothetical protein
MTHSRGPESGTLRSLAIGASIGWVVLPVLVITDDFVRSVNVEDSATPIVWAGIVGAAVGALTGAARLGRIGLVGAIVGALSGALLPYLVIAPLLGLGTIEAGSLDHYSVLFGRYGPIAIAALLGSIVGALGATRLLARIPVRPIPFFVAGVVVLVLWLVSWTFWALALSPRTV